MKKKLIYSTLSALLLAVTQTSHAQTIGAFTTIPDPSAGLPATAIDNSALGISGNYISGVTSDDSTYQYGYLYNSGTGNYTYLMPGGLGSGIASAWSVNSTTVVGDYIPTGGATHGFTYNIASGAYTLLTGPTGATNASANGIDAVTGTIVGGYTIGGIQYGYTYSGGLYTSLALPPGAVSAIARDISGNYIVGNYNTAGGTKFDYYYNIATGTYTTLTGLPGTLALSLFGISGDYAVGNYTDASGVYHGFLYDILTGTYTTVTDPLADATTGTGTAIYGIEGTNIVGTYVYNGGNNASSFQTTFTPAATPEPGTLALAALGAVGGLLAYRRRK